MNDNTDNTNNTANEDNLNNNDNSADTDNTDNADNTNNTDNTDNENTADNEDNENKQWYESDIYGSPETYDFKDVKLPDGMTLAEETTKQFADLARESNLSQIQANKYLQLAVAHTEYVQKKFTEAIQFSKEQQIKKWDNDCKNSDDLKGDNYNKAINLANIAIEKLIPEKSDFREQLKITGLNHHPDFIRVFKILGEQMQSPTIYNGSQTAPEKSMAEKFYPNMNI